MMSVWQMRHHLASFAAYTPVKAVTPHGTYTFEVEYIDQDHDSEGPVLHLVPIQD